MANLSPMLMTRLIGQLTGALRNLRVYPSTHATSQKLFEASLQLVREAMGNGSSLTFSLAGNILLIDEKPVPDSRRDVFANFISELGKRSIGMVVFRQGVDRDQIQYFYEIMAQDVEQVKSQGGVAALLALKGITNIQVAGISYSAGGDQSQGGGTPGSGMGGGGTPTSLDAALPEQLVALLQSDPQMVTEILLKGVVAMADTSENQEKLLSELDRIAVAAKAQGGSNYAPQMAKVIGSMDAARGLWVAQVKLDNPEWRDVIRELLGRYNDQDLIKLIVSKAEVMFLENKDILALNEKLRAMMAAIPVPSSRLQSIYPMVCTALMKFGLGQEDCDFVFGKDIDSKPLLEQYLKDLKDKPPAEMLSPKMFKTLRWLVWREEGCGPAVEGFLIYLSHPDGNVRGLALGRISELLSDLLTGERYDLVEKAIDILCLRIKQELDTQHVFLVVKTIEKVTDELLSRDKKNLASRISQNLSELIILFSDKPVANDIIRILSKIEDETALKILVQALLKEPIFETIATILVQKKAKAIPYLLQAVKESEDKTMRFKNLYVLDRIGQGVEPLAIKALNEERWFVRRNMVILLSLMGSDASIPYLGEALNDKDARVRMEVIRAIYKIGGRASESWLIRALSDKEDEVKKLAIEHLGMAGSDASVDVLTELYAKRDLLGRGENPGVKKQIIAALGHIKLKSSADFLIKVSKDRDPELSQAAQAALAELLKKQKDAH